MSNFCDFCDKEYSSKYALSRHQKIYCKNASVSIEKYKCKYCSNNFISKSSLERHKIKCPRKTEYQLRKDNKKIKIAYEEEISNLNRTVKKSNRAIKNLRQTIKEKDEEFRQTIKEKDEEFCQTIKEKDEEFCQTIKEKDEEFCQTIKEKDEEFRQTIKEKDEEIVELKVKCESGKIEVYDKVCTKVLDKSTVVNNTMNVHPKLVNLPITNIHPLTEGYVKDSVSNGGYTFDHYLKGENGLVDFIYSITMCENDNGDVERNYVCTDPSRDSYHRLVETKEWQKDKGGKFVDVILDTLSDKANDYHMKLFDERTSALKSKCRPKGLGYDPDYVYKVNTDMHSGIVQTKGKDRRNLRQKIKKETSRKISV